MFLSRQIKNGKVLSAHFYGESRHPYRQLPSGTKYSYRAQVGDAKIWQHKRLPYGVGAESRELLDLIVRSLFVGVAHSCLVSS